MHSTFFWPKLFPYLYIAFDFLQDLFTLLSNTARGTKILNFYKENNRLDNINRDEIIAILIEEICYGNISLKPSDFHSLVNEICSVFPSEVETKVILCYIRISNKLGHGYKQHKVKFKIRK